MHFHSNAARATPAITLWKHTATSVAVCTCDPIRLRPMQSLLHHEHLKCESIINSCSVDLASTTPAWSCNRQRQEEDNFSSFLGNSSVLSPAAHLGRVRAFYSALTLFVERPYARNLKAPCWRAGWLYVGRLFSTCRLEELEELACEQSRVVQQATPGILACTLL